MSTETLLGAERLVKALCLAGVERVFSLSGNHIMPVYDALIDSGIQLIHVRHEAAAVHMADAWGRLTGRPGVALLTGGPGHANGIGALYTALAADSPLVMLSGQAPIKEWGRGAFQEMAQADLAAPVTKASWSASSSESLGWELARAFRLASSGRPGPVHLSLPQDVLEARVTFEPTDEPKADAFIAQPQLWEDSLGPLLWDLLQRAKRPLIVTGPAFASHRGEALRFALFQAIGIPIVAMESPRGIQDPALGDWGSVLAKADCVVLLGKRADYTLRFGQVPAVSADCRFAVIDPEEAVMQQSIQTLGASRVVLSAVADPACVLQRLILQCEKVSGALSATRASWSSEVDEAINFRPPHWSTQGSSSVGRLHPLQVVRTVQSLMQSLEHPLLIADGGEFGQWAQSVIKAPVRLINGPAGSIGSAIPFALAAKAARPKATVIALLGDGTMGFHLAEFDTAVRHHLPFVAVVGNDACWNAEYQIQKRNYGPDRLFGCELSPIAAYEKAVVALGGFGQRVTKINDLEMSLKSAIESGLPACVNVDIERHSAPSVSRAIK